ncbi:CGNR zinc finger domain-containing protein [Nakamurella deserti]|uniref:CGNR zinc finger domain-containing protein n=1 Tax=Nakamurella deserti TaxID=2164074 RepID=UPI000DBE5F44|nr:CGNR zinc finger domain-containing protein [Nakamurella deserti]
MFAHDTEWGLTAAAALVNTAVRDEERLPDIAALDRWLDVNDYSGRRDLDEAELRQVRALRPRLRALWSDGDVDRVAGAVNELLAQAEARPFLSRHGGWPWHLHLTPSEAPLASRITAEAAMAFADLIRVDALDRLGRCAAEDCDAVLVDLTRNRSRRFCDTGNCGNRQHVKAYRARRAAG